MTEKEKKCDRQIYHKVAGECLYDKCTIFGKILHFWNWQFYLKYYNKEVKLNDLPQCPKSDRSDELTDRLEHNWKIELENAREKNKKPSLIRTVFKTFGVRLLINSLFCFLPQIALVFQALIMGSLVQNARDLNNKPELKSELWLNAFGMVILHFVHVQATNIYNLTSLHYSIKLRVALSGLMYKKILVLNKSAFLNTSPGQMINLLSNDINKLEMCTHFLPYPLVSLMVIGLVIGLLWGTYGLSVLIGIAVLCVVLPIQILIGKKLPFYFKKAARLTDQRIQLMNEFIPALKIIKMYCWELDFAKKINEARKREATNTLSSTAKQIQKIRAGAYLFSVNLGLFCVNAKLVIFFCLVSYLLRDNSNFLKAEQVFMAFALLNKASFVSSLYIPHFMRQIANTLVSFERIRTLLCLPEVPLGALDSKVSPLFESKSKVSVNNFSGTYDPIVRPKSLFSNGTYNNVFLMNEALNHDGNNENDKKSVQRFQKKDFIECRNLKQFSNCFDDLKKNKIESSISLSNYKLVVKNINFECVPGDLVAIIGPVGSGKTSILMAILHEINNVRGSVNVCGRVSFACQDAWIFTGTIRENILFGADYEELKYEKVVKACFLGKDFQLFPDGDQTLIGDRGTSLSGGQRTRINLARALYYEADIYLLDDPLSSVDANVGNHIFLEAIQSYLSGKIVILVTHQLQHAKNADKILLIKDGEQQWFGDYNSMLSTCNQIDFTNYIGIKNEDSFVETKSKSTSHLSSMTSINSKTSLPIKSKHSIDQSIIQIDKEPLKDDKKKEEQKTTKRQIIQEVNMLQLSRKAYWVYFKLAIAGWKGFFCPALLISFFGAQLVFSYSDYYLSLFTNSEEKKNVVNTGNHNLTSFVNNLSRSQNITIYSCLIAVLLVLSLMKTLLFFKACMHSSIRLHDRLFRQVVAAPISFMETNPIGVLLNRVSRDMGIIDEILPFRLFDAVYVAIIDIATAILIINVKPWLFIPFTILITLVLLIRNLYLKTAKYIRMLEGVAKSPVIQHISCTLNGLTTVRAFKQNARFFTNFCIYQNDHSSAYFMYLLGIRWFVFVLDSLQVILIALVMVEVINFSDSLDGSEIGLIVSNTLLFCSEFQWMIKNLSEVETQLTSVERINQYSKIPQEPALESEPDKKPPADWPQFGSIEFKNVSLRYFADEPPILKNLSFKINGKEKIGIVGRTGAGKSSIIGALFRIYEYTGEIFIDGINIRTIGLHDLRRKLAIIPQEPVLFTGTIRSNLDPLNEKSDQQLWDALKATQLEKTIKNMKEGLESKISDSGGNFSTGQKQLICLVRAILRGSKILVLDEATANTDLKTDELIQATLRSSFADSTLIAVAHRIHTVIDSSRILVMDAGECKEFDTPHKLLQDSSTIFHSLVHSLDKETIEYLKKVVKSS